MKNLLPLFILILVFSAQSFARDFTVDLTTKQYDALSDNFSPFNNGRTNNSPGTFATSNKSAQSNFSTQMQACSTVSFGISYLPIIPGGVPRQLAFGDFDGDGRSDDLAIGIFFSGGPPFQLWTYTGGGFYNTSPSLPYDVNNFPSSTNLADYNGDGHLDIANTLGFFKNEVEVRLGDGTGNFGTPIFIQNVGSLPIAIAAGDINRDGKPDLAVGGPRNQNIVILTNNCIPDDSDADRVPDTTDNCPFTSNPDQADTDGDLIGNVCDLDDDNDNQTDADEIACGSNPLSAASKSLDTNNDNRPNCVDTDDDNDSIADTTDNCPLRSNPDQADFDLDGIGDTCDPKTGPAKNKEQCKNGGWMRFNFQRTFKNQGDCIQFVNTGK